MLFLARGFWFRHFARPLLSRHNCIYLFLVSRQSTLLLVVKLYRCKCLPPACFPRDCRLVRAVDNVKFCCVPCRHGKTPRITPKYQDVCAGLLLFFSPFCHIPSISTVRVLRGTSKGALLSKRAEQTASGDVPTPLFFNQRKTLSVRPLVCA